MTYKAIEVESHVGDCPSEWINEWKSQGYNVIKFCAGSSDVYTQMDQETRLTPDEVQSLLRQQRTEGIYEWETYATIALELHIEKIKEKAVEITKRCALPYISDYTVMMAIREVSQTQ